MSVISFTDVTPQARYDNVAWTEVLIYEAAASTGTWALIDTISLAGLPGGLDTDPSEPQARNITTTLATLTQGWYQLAFSDGVNTSPPSDPIQNAPSVADEIRPTVNDLGAFMRARTVVQGSGGSEAGTFNDLTRPTGSEADSIITQAVNNVLMAIGTDIPAAYYQQTQFVVLVYAAGLVELTFYRNEVNRDQSSYEQYQTLYKDALAALQGAIANEDVASAAPSFWSVPVMNDQQARFQSVIAAIDPTTGILDPSKLPPDMYWPYGVGGIPVNLLNSWGWFGYLGMIGSDLAWLETFL